MEALLVATMKVNHYDKDVAWENKRKENFQRCKNARDELVKEKRKVPDDLDHTGDSFEITPLKVIPPTNHPAQKLTNQQRKPKKPPRSELLKVWLEQKEKERKAIKTKKPKFVVKHLVHKDEGLYGTVKDSRPIDKENVKVVKAQSKDKKSRIKKPLQERNSNIQTGKDTGRQNHIGKQTTLEKPKPEEVRQSYAEWKKSQGKELVISKPVTRLTVKKKERKVKKNEEEKENTQKQAKLRNDENISSTKPITKSLSSSYSETNSSPDCSPNGNSAKDHLISLLNIQNSQEDTKNVEEPNSDDYIQEKLETVTEFDLKSKDNNELVEFIFEPSESLSKFKFDNIPVLCEKDDLCLGNSLGNVEVDRNKTKIGDNNGDENQIFDDKKYNLNEVIENKDNKASDENTIDKVISPKNKSDTKNCREEKGNDDEDFITPQSNKLPAVEDGLCLSTKLQEKRTPVSLPKKLNSSTKLYLKTPVSLFKQREDAITSRTPQKETTPNSKRLSLTPNPKNFLSQVEDPVAVRLASPVRKLVVNKTPGTPPDVSESVKLFTSKVATEEDKFSNFIAKWEKILESNEAPETVTGDILSAIGQAQLLMRKRFKQFKELIELHKDKSAEKAAHASDLDGFWEMIYFQNHLLMYFVGGLSYNDFLGKGKVEDVYRRFSELDKLRNNSWEIKEAKVVKKKIKKPMQPKPNNALTNTKKASKRTDFRKFRQQMKLKKKAEEPQVDDTQVFVAEKSKEIVASPEKKLESASSSNLFGNEDKNEGSDTVFNEKYLSKTIGQPVKRDLLSSGDFLETPEKPLQKPIPGIVNDLISFSPLAQLKEENQKKVKEMSSLAMNHQAIDDLLS